MSIYGKTWIVYYQVYW